ncbi:MAG: DUF5104 domain-containing protein [Bacilli bacterium]|jgi:hypothetical protein|nr:DUF5104 domain-containing protein [Bacilli bacterium]
MIRITTSIFSIFSLIFSTLFIVSCNSENDSEIAEKNLEKLLTAMQSEDINQVKELFANNISTEIDDFDSSALELLNYYDGIFDAYTTGGLGTEVDRDSGIEKKWFNMSYDITTTEDKYRIAMIWYIQDSNDTENIGIWSLYILRFSEDEYPEMSYGGDGLWTNGIHVGVPNIGNQ